MGAKPRRQPPLNVAAIRLLVPLAKQPKDPVCFTETLDPRCPGAQSCTFATNWDSVTCVYCLLYAPSEHQHHYRVYYDANRAIAGRFVCGTPFRHNAEGFDWTEVTCARCLHVFYDAQLSPELLDGLRVITGNMLLEAQQNDIVIAAHTTCEKCFGGKKKSGHRCLGCLLDASHETARAPEVVLAERAGIPVEAALDLMDGFDSTSNNPHPMYVGAYKLGKSLWRRYGQP